MEEPTCVPPNKELHAEQTASETHIKEEETGDTGWQQDGQEDVMCQETYSEDQETHDYRNTTQPTGHPWSETYNSWEQTTHTGRQQDEKRDAPNDETAGIKLEMEESSCGFVSIGEDPGKEMELNGNPGKESASRETQTTDMGLQQETCDVNLPQPDNTSTSQVQETKGITGTQHIRRNRRSREKPRIHKCDQCNYSTSRASYLVQHLTNHHGEKAYMCGECGHRTAYKSGLSSHMKTHTGEKPYKCDQCDYSAARKSTLNRHQAKHTGEKPDKCNVSQHRGTHTRQKPYKCDHCDYSAHREWHFLQHLRTHTGEKPYMCGACGFRTSYKSCLSQHMRTHTGEKPHKCDQCDYSAGQRGHLLRHIAAKHTDERHYMCGL